jgi:ABC-2 type transport system ATP-binding protein
MIEATGLHYAYGSLEAVKGIDVRVGPGEVLGFLGPNGAGKSTTIKMITGQLRPDAGTVRVMGLDLATDRDEAQGHMGVAFEEKNLYDAMTARENLRFFGRLFGRKDVDVEGLLRRVGLADRADDRVKGYSKGMRQRLMMARVLVNEPDVLVLDEPTDGLDPVSARSIRTLIREEAERGASVLLTTHDMHEADELSDRVAFVNEGVVLAEDAPEALKLAHGSRTVRVRTRRDGAVVDESFPLDGATAAGEIAAALSGDVITVHTEEATLEDVFVGYAGRGLEG